MMEFDEFNENVITNIKNYLPIRYEDAQASIHTVVKNNDVQLTGIRIRLKESNLAPCIYLDQYYDQYRSGRDITEIMQDIAEVSISNEMDQQLDISQIYDFSLVKDKIFCKLINGDMNERYLADKPYTQIEDMAIVYAIDLGSTTSGYMSLPITFNLMDQYGVNIHMLHDIAMDNLAESNIVFRSMADVMKELLFYDEMFEEDPLTETMMLSGENEFPMYILSVEDNVNGAAAILDTATMESISEKLGGDFVVIPSSIHEVIIVPVDDDLSRDTLENIVQEVNNSQVPPEERLSYHVYQYDSQKHSLVRMDKKEEQMMHGHEQEQQNNQRNNMHRRVR